MSLIPPTFELDFAAMPYARYRKLIGTPSSAICAMAASDAVALLRAMDIVVDRSCDSVLHEIPEFLANVATRDVAMVDHVCYKTIDALVKKSDHYSDQLEILYSACNRGHEDIGIYKAFRDARLEWERECDEKLERILAEIVHRRSIFSGERAQVGLRHNPNQRPAFSFYFH